MEKKQAITLLALSFVVAVAMFFLDESKYSLSFLLGYKEVFNLMLLTIVISVLPLILYFSLRIKLRNISIYVALLGYIPALFLLVKIIGW